jgi:uncharacterized protein (DUF2236 family)
MAQNGGMTVTAEELESSIAALRREIRDPRAGLYGPGTVFWEVSRELLVFLGGGRAALLQIAHPFVARAIADHSATKQSPLARFHRTFQHVFAMVFGDLEHAIGSARRVHAIHRRIQGAIGERVGPYDEASRYEANDEEALFWVHATLVDSALAAHDAAVAPLDRATRATFYEESRRFARLFGIPDRVMPRTYDAFEEYNRAMWGSLRVCSSAVELAGFLLSPAAIRTQAIAGWYRTMTAGLLPEPIREQLGLAFGPDERRLFDASTRALRRLRRSLPDRLCYLPAYLDAKRRLEGKPGRDPWGVVMERHGLEGLLARPEATAALRDAARDARRGA